MKDSTAMSQKAHAITSFYHHECPSGKDACWYLVDQTKHPEVLRLLFEQDSVPVYDLPYIHSEYREQAHYGPLLIKPGTRQSEKWLQAWLAEGKALALHGPLLTLESVRDHLVLLNTVRSPHGNSLFRYADPATLGSLGASMSHLQHLRVLGPLTAIHGSYAGVNWSLVKDETQVVLSDTDKLYSQPLTLNKENLSAVENHRHRLLANSLAVNSGLSDDIVSSWFQKLIALGGPDEQALVEGARLLLTQGLTRELSESEFVTIRKFRQGACWSDTLEALSALAHSQEGT